MEEQIKKITSGDFEEVRLIGNISHKGEISFTLELKENYSYEHKGVSENISLDELNNNPKEFLESLLNNYLNNNDNIVTGAYYNKSSNKKNEIDFKIFGTTNLEVVLDRNLMELLPDQFMAKIEKRKRECLADYLNGMEIDRFRIINLDGSNLNLSLLGGTLHNEFIYNVLATKDNNDKTTISDEELKLAKDMLKVILENGEIDLDYLTHIKEIIEREYSNITSHNEEKTILKRISEKLGSSFTHYLILKLNDKTEHVISNLPELKIFLNFLKEYLSNQLKQSPSNQR